MVLSTLIRRPLMWLIGAPGIYRGEYRSDPEMLKTRKQHVKEIKNTHYDVVIIGGGATGAGLAVECATRGLKSVVLEGHDFASGTSCKSTKLIHGGIRYLETAMKKADPAQLKLVFTGLRERSHMRIAGGDMLTNAVGMCIPQRRKMDCLVTGIGVKLYQAFAKLATPGGDVRTPNSMLMRSTMAGHLVNCAKRWRYSLLFFDGQHIDHRSVMHLINTATQDHYVKSMVAANAANHLKVVGTDKDPDTGAVNHVMVKDDIAGEEFKVTGTIFINCAGPFSDMVRKTVGNGDTKALGGDFIRASSGIHLVFPKRILNEHGGNTGVLIPKTSRGSVCYILPYQDYVLAGTTDTQELATISPSVTKDEVQYLCSEIAASVGIDQAELERSILSSWKGFRPLVVPPKAEGKGAGGVSRVVRSHLVKREMPNFYSVMGGKWTSHREMAQDTVDYIFDMRTGLFGRHKVSSIAYDGPLAEELRAKVLPSRSFGLKWNAATQSARLRHAHFSGLENRETNGVFAGLLSRQYDIDPNTTDRLMRYYGYFGWDLLYSGRMNNSNKPLQNVHFASKILRSEIEWLCSNEQGVRLSDVVCRRLGLSFLDTNVAAASLPEIAIVMQKCLGWSDREMKEEIRDAALGIKKMAYHPVCLLDKLSQ